MGLEILKLRGAAHKNRGSLQIVAANITQKGLEATKTRHSSLFLIFPIQLLKPLFLNKHILF